MRPDVTVYVYYRVAAGDVGAFRIAHRTLVATLSGSLSGSQSGSLPGSSGVAPVQLMCRLATPPATQADPQETSTAKLQTWMEIWPLGPAGLYDVARIRTRIEAAAAAVGLPALIDGDRHYEIFEQCA